MTSLELPVGWASPTSSKALSVGEGDSRKLPVAEVKVATRDENILYKHKIANKDQ